MSASLRLDRDFCSKSRKSSETADDRKKEIARDVFKAAQKVFLNGRHAPVHVSYKDTCSKKCLFKRAKDVNTFRRKMAWFIQEQLFTDSSEHRLDALRVFPQLRAPMQHFLSQADGSELRHAFCVNNIFSLAYRDSPLPSVSFFATVTNPSQGTLCHVYKTPGHCPNIHVEYPFGTRFQNAGDPGIPSEFAEGIDAVRHTYTLSRDQEGLFTVPLYANNTFEAARSIVTGEEHDLVRSSVGLFLTIPTEPFVPFVREFHLQAFVSFVFAHQISIGEDKTGLPELVLMRIHHFIAGKTDEEQEDQ
jgi:hypothetical protein